MYPDRRTPDPREVARLRHLLLDSITSNPEGTSPKRLNRRVKEALGGVPNEAIVHCLKDLVSTGSIVVIDPPGPSAPSLIRFRRVG